MKLYNLSSSTVICSIIYLFIGVAYSKDSSDRKRRAAPAPTRRCQRTSNESRCRKSDLNCLFTARHNDLRILHENTPPLVNDWNLNKRAQNWADRLASEDRQYHSGNGENVGGASTWSSSGRLSGSALESWTRSQILEIVQDWYNEIVPGEVVRSYDPSKGHYTQVVWAGSRSLGLGWKVYNSGEWTKIVVVGQYSPAGNMIGDFVNNVKPLKRC